VDSNPSVDIVPAVWVGFLVMSPIIMIKDRSTHGKIIPSELKLIIHAKKSIVILILTIVIITNYPN